MKKIIFLIILIFSTALFSKNAHYMTISKTIFSKNGDLVYSASFDSTGIIWNVKTGKALKRMIGQRGFMTSMAISNKFNRIITTARDKTIAVRLLNGIFLRRIRTHSDAVNCVVIKDRIAVTSSDNGEIFIWNFPRMWRIRAFKFNVPGIDSLSISHDGVYLAAGCVDGNIRIINLKTRRHIKTIQAYENYIYSVLFSTTNFLISSSSSGKITIWNVKTFQKIKSIKLKSGIFSMLEISGSLLAGTKKGRIYLLNPKTLYIKKVYNISRKEITAISYDKKNGIIAAGDGAGAIHLLKYPGLKKIKILGR